MESDHYLAEAMRQIPLLNCLSERIRALSESLETAMTDKQVPSLKWLADLTKELWAAQSQVWDVQCMAAESTVQAIHVMRAEGKALEEIAASFDLEPAHIEMILRCQPEEYFQCRFGSQQEWYQTQNIAAAERSVRHLVHQNHQATVAMHDIASSLNVTLDPEIAVYMIPRDTIEEVRMGDPGTRAAYENGEAALAALPPEVRAAVRRRNEIQELTFAEQERLAKLLLAQGVSAEKIAQRACVPLERVLEFGGR